MATAPAARIELIPAAQHPRVLAIERAQAPGRAARQQLRIEVERLRRQAGRQDDADNASAFERRETRAKLPALEVRLAEEEIREADEDKELAAAIAAVRAEARKASDIRKKKLVAELDKALAAAAEINEALRAEEQQRHEVLNEHVDFLAWLQLARSTPTFTSRLDEWRALARGYGYL
jgi:hypothetical protein